MVILQAAAKQERQAPLSLLHCCWQGICTGASMVLLQVLHQHHPVQNRQQERGREGKNKQNVEAFFILFSMPLIKVRRMAPELRTMHPICMYMYLCISKAYLLLQEASNAWGLKFASTINTGAEHILYLKRLIHSGVRNFSCINKQVKNQNKNEEKPSYKHMNCFNPITCLSSKLVRSINQIYASKRICFTINNLQLLPHWQHQLPLLHYCQKYCIQQQS